MADDSGTHSVRCRGSETRTRTARRTLACSERGRHRGRIERSIQSADIAVFDVTPKRGRINENVLIEIGMAKGRAIEVILIAKSTAAHKALPSDLQGMQVRAYAAGDEGGRRSIRAIVQSAVKRAKKELTGKEPS